MPKGIVLVLLQLARHRNCIEAIAGCLPVSVRTGRGVMAQGWLGVPLVEWEPAAWAAGSF